MADEKQTKLSIVVRTVDQATARIKAINERLDAITKPTRDFKAALSDLGEKSGLNDVIGGFKGVGSALSDLLSKVALIGGVAGAAVVGLLHIVDGFDELGDKAEAIGVGVDFLAQMRYAAERSGLAVESLDTGLQGFSKSLGQARAGTGRMAAFLTKVSPALLKQLKAAKDNEAAFDLLSDAMAKLKDPAKQAALASATLGDAAAAPLLAKGAKGIKSLRDEHLGLAGSQKEAAEKAGAVDDAMKKLKASTDGIKAALVTGLGPALEGIIKKLTDWLVGHREDVAAWAKEIGEKLPGAIEKVATWIQKAFNKVSAFIDKIGGLRNAAIGVAAIMAGPLIGSIVSLSGALISAVSRAGQLGKALASIGPAGAGGGGGALGALGALGPIGLAIGGAYVASELTGGPIGEGRGGVLGVGREMLEHQAKLKKLHAMGRTELTDSVFQSMDAARSQPDISAQAGDALAAAQANAKPAEAKITIDLNNAPRGTRVRTDPQSTADVDLSVGYQMVLSP